jgi:phosphonate transport system substrate-binding protein
MRAPVARRALLDAASGGAHTCLKRREEMFGRYLLVLLSVLVSSATFAQTLRVSAIPDENPTELQRKFAPLGKYLENALKMKVAFTPVTDYAATVEGLAAKKLDLVWYGGFTFVQASRRTKGSAIPLVQREEDEKFRSVLITRADSGIKKISDLKGKNFAFGSVSSTSGHLMPRYFLLKDGINPDKDMRVAFSGAHDATALQVAGGKVDAGALNISVWQKMLDEKRIDSKQVVVFYTTPPYYDYNWTVRGDLDPKVIENIRKAFLALDAKNPAHAEILKLQRATRFISTKADNYKSIEEAARSAGLLKD